MLNVRYPILSGTAPPSRWNGCGSRCFTESSEEVKLMADTRICSSQTLAMAFCGVGFPRGKTHNTHTRIHTHTHICVYVYVYVYMCICVYDYLYMCICVYVYMYICIYVYMYICIYVQCYVYIYISVCEMMHCSSRRGLSL